MAAEAAAFFIVLDGVNIRALTEFIDKIPECLNYYMGRIAAWLRVCHSIKFVYMET
jgi:hypothetical protein